MCTTTHNLTSILARIRPQQSTVTGNMPNKKDTKQHKINSQTERDVVARLPRPGFIKRMLVIIYDGLLWLAVMFLAASLTLVVPDSLAAEHWVRALKGVYLIGISFLFYGWFWTHGGQTLGMRVWHLHLVDQQGKYPSWGKAAQRFALAAVSWAVIGLGFTWILLSPKRAAWHDSLSGTSIVRITPK